MQSAKLSDSLPDTSDVVTAVSPTQEAADDISLPAVPAAISVPEEQIATSPSSPMGTTASGEAAVARLGTDLAAVARAYGKDPEELTRTLLSDKELKVDAGNNLLYE
jgi:hypothetical protein